MHVRGVWGWWYMAGECYWDKLYFLRKSGNVLTNIPLEMIKRLILVGRLSGDVKYFESLRLRCQSDLVGMGNPCLPAFFMWEETGRNSGFLIVNLPASRLCSQSLLPWWLTQSFSYFSFWNGKIRVSLYSGLTYSEFSHNPLSGIPPMSCAACRCRSDLICIVFCCWARP